MREWAFIQAVKVDGQPIEPDFIVSCAYIETGDLSGPKLILSLRDQIGYFRDDIGIKKGAEIEITMGEVHAENDDVWIERFIVAKPTSAGDILTIEGFATTIAQIKSLVAKPRFFVEQSPAAIIKALLPGVKYNVDSFPASTYHLNVGMTASRLLRTMARDCGAMCWYARGTLHFKSMKAIARENTQLTVEAGKHHAPINIERYSILGEDELYERILEKSFFRWDTVEGIERGGKYSDKAASMISVASKSALSNQSIGMVPHILIETLGNNAFSPGVNLEVLFHKLLPEQSIDESIPEKQTIYQVTHFQEGSKYNCKLEMVTLHE